MTYRNTLQMNMMGLMCGMYMCGMTFCVEKFQTDNIPVWIVQK